MTTLADYREERLRKLKEIRERGIDPYPAKSYRDTKIQSILNDFDNLNGKTVTIAGRITAIRSFGKLAFVKIRDYTGEIQIFMRTESAPSDNNTSDTLSIKDLKLLDTGDFIEATGTVDKTKTGEISVFSNKLQSVSFIISANLQLVLHESYSFLCIN